MLDRASLRKLGEAPERNDPLLNVALAEEGSVELLLSLASCPAVLPEALSVVAARIAGEGLVIEGDPEAKDEGPAIELEEVERALICHANAAGPVRDAILARHEDDPVFALAAAAHPRATTMALEGAARWPSTSPLHERSWLSLLEEGAAVAPALVERWASGDELLREAAARLTRDPRALAELGRDEARRVRRAVASNPHAGALRGALAADAAPEVRARARLDLGRSAGAGAGAPSFDASLAAMQAGGHIAPEVTRALLDAGADLDEEGALLAARHFGHDQLLSLVSTVTINDEEALSQRGVGVGTGLSLRVNQSASAAAFEDGEGPASLTTQIVHLLTRRPSQSTRLTGKARFASWMAESLAQSRVIDVEALGREALPGTLAGDRMVLMRSLRRSKGAPWRSTTAAVPHALVELSWVDPNVTDDEAIALATRIAPAPPRGKDLPEDELDLAPCSRPLATLERAVLAAITRTPVSPRAALAAIAMEPRRIRYVLSAVPTWKGTLTGARLMRVLSAHAGALSAAAPTSSGPHAANVARWTDRSLSEVETSVAIAVGDLTVPELLRRLAKGSLKLQDGVTLAAGVEARAAIDGPATFAKLLEYAASRRTSDPAALALWILLEGLERARASSLIASSIDGLTSASSVVAPGVCEALATLERRTPGRLETIFAQSPRGRTTIASAIARAYRAVGGMRDEG